MNREEKLSFARMMNDWNFSKYLKHSCQHKESKLPSYRRHWEEREKMQWNFRKTVVSCFSEMNHKWGEMRSFYKAI